MVRSKGIELIGEQADGVGFAVRPAVLQMDGGAAQAGNARLGRDFEGPDGVIDHDLSDGQLVGTGIADDDIDVLGLQERALEGQRFDRGRRGQRQPTAGAQEQKDHATQRDQRQEQQDQAGGAQADGFFRVRDRVFCHGMPRYKVTSKCPVQPSSANSVLWAWNIYRPGYL